MHRGGSSARAPDAGARLPQGQGPAAGRDPAARPRGGARRGAPQRLGSWYGDAIDDAGIAPVGEPELDVGDAARRGRAAVVLDRDRRPPGGEARRATRGSRSAAASPRSRRRRSTTSSSGLRERFATLETVERAGGRGDFVVIDYAGTHRRRAVRGRRGARPAGRARRRAADPRLRGAARRRERPARSAPSTSRSPTTTAPRSSRAARRAFDGHRQRGPREAAARARRRVRRRAAGFDTLAELREDIPRRLRRGRRARGRARVPRGGARRRRGQARRSRCPTQLVDARAHECSRSTMLALARQGISKEAYLQIAGKDEETLARRGRARGRARAQREAVLAAIVEAERIEPSDEELLEALAAERRARGYAEPMSCSNGCVPRPPRAAAPGRRRPPGARAARRARPSRSRSSRRRRARSSGARQGGVRARFGRDLDARAVGAGRMPDRGSCRASEAVSPC